MVSRVPVNSKFGALEGKGLYSGRVRNVTEYKSWKKKK